LIAGQIAGLNYDRRNLFRVENKPAVAARIAWLCRDEAENIRRKRQGLEEFLWQALQADRADFYESVEIPITDRHGKAVLKRNGEPYTKTVTQPKPLEKLTAQQRCLIESITYTESGKPNLKLVSKEYCHRELRKMLGGDAQPGERAKEFSNFSDAELLAELDRVANDLGIKTASVIEPSDPPIAPP
jgi:hypothetical protein